mmetsp:Transcript_54700/g.113422  ORF Transcript_54700/g.113422 Transcript_54700/m.113422 type:complete len:258 (+) Transcript_54700:74-847(+)
MLLLGLFPLRGEAVQQLRPVIDCLVCTALTLHLGICWPRRLHAFGEALRHLAPEVHFSANPTRATWCRPRVERRPGSMDDVALVVVRLQVKSLEVRQVIELGPNVRPLEGGVCVSPLELFHRKGPLSCGLDEAKSRSPSDTQVCLQRAHALHGFFAAWQHALVNWRHVPSCGHMPVCYVRVVAHHAAQRGLTGLRVSWIMVLQGSRRGVRARQLAIEVVHQGHASAYAVLGGRRVEAHATRKSLGVCVEHRLQCKMT